MGLLLAVASDDDGRFRWLLLPVMSLEEEDCCCNVQSQSMLTADEFVNSTIRIPDDPTVTLSTLSHPALLQELPVVNTSSNPVIVKDKYHHDRYHHNNNKNQ